jgi:hypothetical protein
LTLKVAIFMRNRRSHLSRRHAQFHLPPPHQLFRAVVLRNQFPPTKEQLNRINHEPPWQRTPKATTVKQTIAHLPQRGKNATILHVRMRFEIAHNGDPFRGERTA